MVLQSAVPICALETSQTIGDEETVETIEYESNVEFQKDIEHSTDELINTYVSETDVKTNEAEGEESTKTSESETIDFDILPETSEIKESVETNELNEDETDKYTITYVLDGGTNHPSNPTFYIHSEISGVVELFEPATKDGYEFGGWYLDSKFTQQFGGLNSSQTGDITLYAKWIKIEPKIYFTYEMNGGTNPSGNPEIESVTVGKTYTTYISIPTKKGYTFDGWYTNRIIDESDPENSEKFQYSGMLPYDSSKRTYVYSSNITETTTNVTLYAVWRPITYSVRISSLNKTFRVTYDEEFTLPATNRKGYYA